MWANQMSATDTARLEPTDQAAQHQRGGWNIGVGQIVGDRAGPGADQVPEQPKVGNRQQGHEQPP